MKAIISLIVLVLLFISGTAQAHSWQHFGADKAYPDRASAIADTSRVLKEAGWPDEVIKLMEEQMAKPGVRAHVDNGMTLDFMRSGKSALWRNVPVAFDKPPIKDAMEYSAPSEEWSVTWHGKTYTIGIPDVCRNVYGKTSAAPRVAIAAPEQCVELSFDAPVGGYVRWGVGTTSGPLPPSACNAQKQGDSPWQAWYGLCDECTGAVEYIQGILGQTATIPHKYLYAVKSSHQTLRFSTAILQDVVYICMENANGLRSCGVYTRPEDWKGRKTLTIPDSDWVWDDNCPG